MCTVRISLSECKRHSLGGAFIEKSLRSALGKSSWARDAGLSMAGMLRAPWATQGMWGRWEYPNQTSSCFPKLRAEFISCPSTPVKTLTGLLPKDKDQGWSRTCPKLSKTQSLAGTRKPVLFILRWCSVRPAYLSLMSLPFDHCFSTTLPRTHTHRSSIIWGWMLRPQACALRRAAALLKG